MFKIVSFIDFNFQTNWHEWIPQNFIYHLVSHHNSDMSDVRAEKVEKKNREKRKGKKPNKKEIS